MPKPLILRGVDLLTSGTCSAAKIHGNCATDPVKSRCAAAGGECVIQTDGYYIMSGVCISLGAILLVTYILPTVKRLQCECWSSSPLSFSSPLQCHRPSV